MKKRALSLFLALCLALTLCTGVGFPVSAQTYSGGCGAEGDCALR